MSDLLAQADEMLRRGERERAAEAYARILQDEPRNALALHRLGIVEFQRGRRQEALARMAEAISIRPDAQILSDCGLVLTSLGDLGAALASYDGALALRPDLAETHCRRGDVLRGLGRAGEAAASYDRALALSPGFAQALNNRGLALMALGRRDEALASYDEALAVRPDYVLAHCNRGRALQELGRLEEALQGYGRALELDPACLEALNNRGVALQALGRMDEALVSLEAALALRPDYAEAIVNRANLLMALGRLEEALAGFEQVLAANPGLALAWTNRGNVLRDLGRFDEALASYETALSLAPASPEALSGKGLVLWKLGRPAEALAAYDGALALDPGRAGTWNLKGLALVGLERPQEALASYERAIALDPALADAHGNRGMLLIELGRADEAREAVERALALEPRSARGWYILSLCRRMAPGDPQLAAMLKLAGDIEALEPDEQVHLRFALAKVFEDLGELGEWAAQIEAGARLKRSLLPYDEAAALGQLERTRAAFGKARLARASAPTEASPAPIFIVGMPRSGSTLIEQILASHPEVATTGETDHFAMALRRLEQETGAGLRTPEAQAGLDADQLARLGELYLGQVGAAARPGVRIVNKTLENFRHVGLIRLALPGARILQARRDPVDACLSCWSKLFADSLPYTYDLGELGRYWRGYEALMAHWRKALPAGAMLEVQYEELVADPEGQARRILAHCGLDWDPRCLAFHAADRWVHTASAAQVRQPIYASAVGRWRAYEPYLKPLLEILRG
jgi:tetratricopeptide (TPR) repeat protein